MGPLPRYQFPKRIPPGSPCRHPSRSSKVVPFQHLASKQLIFAPRSPASLIFKRPLSTITVTYKPICMITWDFHVSCHRPQAALTSHRQIVNLSSINRTKQALCNNPDEIHVQIVQIALKTPISTPIFTFHPLSLPLPEHTEHPIAIPCSFFAPDPPHAVHTGKIALAAPPSSS
jgi:hypothetical protein